MYNTYIFRPILGALSVFNFERVYLKSKFSGLRPCGLQGLNYHCAEKKNWCGWIYATEEHESDPNLYLDPYATEEHESDPNLYLDPRNK